METIIFIVLIALFLMAFVLFYNSYNQYKKSPSKRDLTGFDAAQAVTRDYNLDNYIIEQRGSYTDNYNYNKKVIKLSSLVFHDNNSYSAAMGYFIAMQAVLDKENNKMFKIRKLFEPLFYALMSLSYLGIVLLAFANLDLMFLITILGLCLIYELVFVKQNLDIINRIKSRYAKNDSDLVGALSTFYIIDMAFGVLYIRVLIDKLIDLIKHRWEENLYVTQRFISNHQRAQSRNKGC